MVDEPHQWAWLSTIRAATRLAYREVLGAARLGARQRVGVADEEQERRGWYIRRLHHVAARLDVTFSCETARHDDGTSTGLVV